MQLPVFTLFPASLIWAQSSPSSHSRKCSITEPTRVKRELYIWAPIFKRSPRPMILKMHFHIWAFFEKPAFDAKSHDDDCKEWLFGRWDLLPPSLLLLLLPLARAMSCCCCCCMPEMSHGCRCCCSYPFSHASIACKARIRDPLTQKSVIVACVRACLPRFASCEWDCMRNWPIRVGTVTEWREAQTHCGEWIEAVWIYF